MQGWIRMHRRFIEWEWYRDNNVKVLFLHLLLTANHKEKEWKGHTIKRGELVTSISSLSKHTNLSSKQVRGALQKLSKTGETAIKTTNKFTLLTIVNYDKYQGETQEEGKQEGKQRANKGQTKGKQRATNKNDKNIIYTDAFNLMWEYYRENKYECPEGEKKKAFIVYDRLLSEFDHDLIFAHIKSYLAECKKTKTKSKHMSTFLNQHDFNEPVKEPEQEKEWRPIGW